MRRIAPLFRMYSWLPRPPLVPSSAAAWGLEYALRIRPGLVGCLAGPLCCGVAELVLRAAAGWRQLGWQPFTH